MKRKPLTLIDAVKGVGRGLLVRAKILRAQEACVADMTRRWENGEAMRQMFYPDWPADAWWERYGRWIR